MPPLTEQEIAHAHAVDDLAKQLATATRSLREIRALLGTALEASHDGNCAVTQEYVDRALIEAARALDKLIR